MCARAPARRSTANRQHCVCGSDNTVAIIDVVVCIFSATARAQQNNEPCTHVHKFNNTTQTYTDTRLIHQHGRRLMRNAQCARANIGLLVRPFVSCCCCVCWAVCALFGVLKLRAHTVYQAKPWDRQRGGNAAAGWPWFTVCSIRVSIRTGALELLLANWSTKLQCRLPPPKKLAFDGWLETVRFDRMRYYCEFLWKFVEFSTYFMFK